MRYNVPDQVTLETESSAAAYCMCHVTYRYTLPLFFRDTFTLTKLVKDFITRVVTFTSFGLCNVSIQTTHETQERKNKMDGFLLLNLKY